MVEIKDGSAAGRHCVIIDDLVQTGGTLLQVCNVRSALLYPHFTLHQFFYRPVLPPCSPPSQCAEALRAAGATNVWCYVTHAVFPEDSWKRYVA